MRQQQGQWGPTFTRGREGVGGVTNQEGPPCPVGVCHAACHGPRPDGAHLRLNVLGRERGEPVQRFRFSACTIGQELQAAAGPGAPPCRAGLAHLPRNLLDELGAALRREVCAGLEGREVWHLRKGGWGGLGSGFSFGKGAKRD